MKKFYAHISWNWTFPEEAIASGAIIFPSGIAQHTLERRQFKKYPVTQNRLLDPQLYLAGLSPTISQKECTNLISYDWFPRKQKVPKYDSKIQKQQDWKRINQADIHRKWGGLPSKGYAEKDRGLISNLSLNFQKKINCEKFILPSPLTTDIATDYSDELQWLDAGLEISQAIDSDTPPIATIAISDHCLRSINPWENPLLELILDQVSARNPSGVYIVIEQANENGYYCTHPNTIGSLLRLVQGFKAAKMETVIVPFAGMAGFLALLAGADIWSSGWYRSHRRLKLSDYENATGRAYPAYYSHNFASEFHLKNDLNTAIKAKLLPRIKDLTPASKILFEVIEKGLPIELATEWKYSQSNVAASIEHFLFAAIRETEKISPLSQDELHEYGKTWLEEAEELAIEIAKLEGLNERTQTRHQITWNQAFNEYLANY